MSESRVLVAFAALCVVALFFVYKGVRAAFAPLCAVCVTALWFALFGALGLLVLGGWLYYLLALLLLLWLCWRYALRPRALPAGLERLKNPGAAAPKKLLPLGFGFWFFVVAGLAMMLLLWVKQPMFVDWDEFSFWGTAGKLMKQQNVLYTVAEVGWAGVPTQKPALVVFGYFFQFLGGGFHEWQTYAAYAVFQLAAIAAILAPFDKKSWQLALPVALVCVLAPFLFLHYYEIQILSPVFLTTLADLPLGLMFAAALGCWYAGEREKPGAMLPLCLALATLTMMKDIALVLALIAAVLVFFDALLAKRDDAPKLRQKAKGALWRLALCLGSIAVVFVLWEIYTGATADLDRLNNIGGSYEVGMLGMPFAFLGELFSANKSELFRHVTGGMLRMFFTSRGTMLGSGVMVMAGIWALCAAAALLSKQPAHRRRCIVYGVFSTLGFFAYYLFVTMSYLYIMRPAEALAFDSYNRYVYPFYMAWFLVAVLLLAQSAREGIAWRAVLGRVAVLGLSAVLFLRVAQLVPVHLTVFGLHPEEYSERRELAQNAEQLQQRLDPNGKTFLVSSDDLGLKFFMFCHDMLPWQVDYSYGGGMLRTSEKQPDGNAIVHDVTADELAAHLIETGCTTLYIDNADADFAERFAPLFADGLDAYHSGETRLYEVVAQNGQVLLHPLYG